LQFSTLKRLGFRHMRGCNNIVNRTKIALIMQKHFSAPNASIVVCSAITSLDQRRSLLGYDSRDGSVGAPQSVT